MDRLLEETETRQRLGQIGRTKLWELTRSGDLRSVKLGRRRMYPESEIERFIGALKGAPQTRD